MGSLMTRQQQMEKSKRYWFLGTGVAGLALGVFASKFLGVILLGTSVYLGYQWFKFRAKNGMRF